MNRPLSILIMNRKYDQTIGGVERMSVLLANQMAHRYGHKCHIVSLDLPEATMYFDLDKNVRWHKIATVDAARKATWGERFQRFLKIRQILKSEKIDVAIGFQDGAFLSVALAALGTGVPVIAAERNAPSRFDFLKNKNLKKIVMNSFRMAKKITVQCESYITGYPSYLRDKIAVIANPVAPARVRANPEGMEGQRKQILFVGRLGFQKNLETLITAFSLCGPKNPAWDLKIVGDGEDFEKLSSRAQSLGLGERVIFAGPSKDVSSYYAAAHIFCLPSLWEGFPNALAEAMSHGLPCIGFAQCSGVRDLIVHEKSGLLVEGDMQGAAKLSHSLERLMKDAPLRCSMGDASFEKSKDYNPDKIFSQWNDLFKSLAP
jgi:GalNAc-alpha-(1->4)-GalNAc-alpha-(1->3)-diNAcBac-PP-undecaprenol alpha-1,4-N-acetyl-D-galactosaminyltransferase